jgi:hypothetical protein
MEKAENLRETAYEAVTSRLDRLADSLNRSLHYTSVMRDYLRERSRGYGGGRSEVPVDREELAKLGGQLADVFKNIPEDNSGAFEVLRRLRIGFIGSYFTALDKANTAIDAVFKDCQSELAGDDMFRTTMEIRRTLARTAQVADRVFFGTFRDRITEFGDIR